VLGTLDSTGSEGVPVLFTRITSLKEAQGLVWRVGSDTTEDALVFHVWAVILEPEESRDLLLYCIQQGSGDLDIKIDFTGDIATWVDNDGFTIFCNTFKTSTPAVL